MTIAKLVLPALVMTLGAMAADKVEYEIPQGFSLVNAKTIQIKDHNGQVLLSGTFGPEDSDKDDSELEALLTGTGSKAKGRAEIEYEQKNNAITKQELDLELEGLAASANVTIVIDGKDLRSITVDKSGDADLKFAGKK
jgi:hypothetical protein